MVGAIKLDPSGCAASGLERLVDSVGEPSFGDELLTYLRRIYGAEHLAVFRHGGEKPSLFMTESAHAEIINSHFKIYLERYWGTDPIYPVVERASRDVAPSLLQMDASTIDTEMHKFPYAPLQFCDRTLLAGRAAGSRISVSMVRPRSRGLMPDEAVDRLKAAASVLLSLISKHEKVVAKRFDMARALASVRGIEECIVGAGARLPPREAQVCARILYGVTAAGIALDLRISEGTVTTYRKRIYHRLGISSQHELLRWYLAEWSGAQATSH